MKRKKYTRTRRGPDDKIVRIGDYVAITGRNRLAWGVNIWLQNCVGGRARPAGSNTFVCGQVGFATPQDALHWARAMVLTGAL